jgi:glycosyltransferase involved in cell wall biosynthesis
VPLKVAYLVNQYPAVSHSFIRREIAALESHGVEVVRFSVRPPPAELVDPADIAEQKQTHVLLGAGAGALLAALLGAALQAPWAWFTAAAAAVRCGRRSDRGVLRHLVYLAEACVLLARLRASGNVRHLHAHFGTNSATVAMLTRLLGGPPFSFTVHGPEEFDAPVALSLPEKIDRAAAVIAVSDFGRSQLYRWTDARQWPKVHVVRCGVDAAFLAGGPQPVADNRRLVCVGRLVEQKGQLLVLAAIAELARETIDLELVLAGDGPLRPLVEARLRELRIDDRVRITGWISNAAVRDEIVAARAMLLPSFAEGLPVVLMEALALGRPAITTYVAGIPELVENGRNGWLIPAGSIDAMKRAIRTALTTPPDELARMGSAGAEVVAERHDARKEADRLATLFRQLAAEDGGAAGQQTPALVNAEPAVVAPVGQAAAI